MTRLYAHDCSNDHHGRECGRTPCSCECHYPYGAVCISCGSAPPDHRQGCTSPDAVLAAEPTESTESEPKRTEPTGWPTR